MELSRRASVQVATGYGRKAPKTYMRKFWYKAIESSSKYQKRKEKKFGASEMRKHVYSYHATRAQEHQYAGEQKALNVSNS